MRTTRLTLTIAALLCSSTAWAGSPPWVISESSGAVNVVKAGATKVAQRGGALAIGDIVATGARGRAVLVRGQEYLIVSPNSRISIADPAQSGGFVQIVQNWGSAIFKIEKKTEKHFAVRTPFLAAVVKGTTFNVTVDAKGARVQVTEGRVEVATPDGKAVSMVLPGEMGLVSASDVMRLRVQGVENRTLDSPQRPGTPEGGATDPPAAEVATARAEQRQTAATVLPVDASEAPVTRPSTPPSTPTSVRISAPIGEGEVRLASLTFGMVKGDSSLVPASPVVTEAVRDGGRGDPKPAADTTAVADAGPAGGRGDPKPAADTTAVADAGPAGGRGDPKPAADNTPDARPGPAGRGDPKPAADTTAVADAGPAGPRGDPKPAADTTAVADAGPAGGRGDPKPAADTTPEARPGPAGGRGDPKPAADTTAVADAGPAGGRGDPKPAADTTAVADAGPAGGKSDPKASGDQVAVADTGPSGGKGSGSQTFTIGSTQVSIQPSATGGATNVTLTQPGGRGGPAKSTTVTVPGPKGR